MVVKVFLSILLFSLSSFVQARDLTDFQVEITSPLKGAEAKQEALDQATEKGVFQLTEQLLGSERASKVWSQISPKLLKNSSRYVLFIKGSVPQETPEGTKVQVQMRLSPDALEAALREAGVMANSTVRLLPLIRVNEAKGTRYFWWGDDGDPKAVSDAQDYFKRALKVLAGQFKGKTVYMLDPSTPSFRVSVPVSYRLENLRREDQILLGQYLKADVVLSGKIDVVKPRPESSDLRVDYSLQLWQSKTGRMIAEVETTEPVTGDTSKAVASVIESSSGKVFGGLATKLNEVIASGNLNLNVVRVAVVGAMTYRQQADFKRLLENLRDIRLLKERLFEPYRITFEAETSVTGKDLAKVVEKGNFPQFKVDVDSAQDDGLVLNVKALSSAQ